MRPRAPEPLTLIRAMAIRTIGRATGLELPTFFLMKIPGADTTNRLARFGRRRDPSPNTDADLVVSLWKAAWVEGANARWTPGASTANPHAAGMERSAWDAGWEWAAQNPDRRRNSTPRLAHRRQRATDSPVATSVKRAMGLGAAGVAVYAIAKAVGLWRRSPRSES
jgi:hypothetical protein